MAGWHHRCNGHDLGQTLRDDEGQGGLVCYRPWGRKESDTSGQLNNNNIHLLGFPDGSDGKESACNAGFDPLSLISGLERFPWRREWLPIPVFCSSDANS